MYAASNHMTASAAEIHRPCRLVFSHVHQIVPPLQLTLRCIHRFLGLP